jgi:hypothetical protein
VDTGSIIAICVSGVSIAIALGSFVLSIRADRRAGRAERRGRQANPIVTSRGANGSGREFSRGFDVFNDGPATITHLEIWVADHKGDPISGADTRDLVLIAGESVALAVNMVNPEANGQTVWVRWTDPEGVHEKPNPEIYIQPGPVS